MDPNATGSLNIANTISMINYAQLYLTNHKQESTKRNMRSYYVHIGKTETLEINIT